MAELLLVRNDPEEAAELASVLRELGHTVYVESSAWTALACLEQECIDAVVCDEVVPGMVADDLIVAARNILGRPHLPAIVMSELPAELRAHWPVPERFTVITARSQ